jgi:hypothetical protein
MELSDNWRYALWASATPTVNRLGISYVRSLQEHVVIKLKGGSSFSILQRSSADLGDVVWDAGK